MCADGKVKEENAISLVDEVGLIAFVLTVCLQPQSIGLERALGGGCWDTSMVQNSVQVHPRSIFHSRP